MKRRLIVIVVGDRDEMKGCIAVVGGGAQATACVFRSEKTFVVRSLLPTSQGLWKPNSGLQGCLERLDWPNHLTNPKEIKLLSMVVG